MSLRIMANGRRLPAGAASTSRRTPAVRLNRQNRRMHARSGPGQAEL